MKIQEAIQAMREGKLVFRREWAKDGHYSGTLKEFGGKSKSLREPTICFRSYGSNSNMQLNSDDLLAEDWTYEGRVNDDE